MTIRPQELYFNVFLILLSVLCLQGCAANKLDNNALESNHTLQQNTTQNVLVVNSNQSVDRYRVAETVYINSLIGASGVDIHTTVLNLETEAQPIKYLQDMINQSHYDIVYCIGAKALGSIDYIDPDMPVIYSAVLNWRKFQHRNNFFGIASELSPEVQLTWFKYFFPKLNDIGVLYSEESHSLIEDAELVAENLSLNINALKLNNDGQLMLSAKKLLKNVDALWLISDSKVVSSIKNLDSLFHLADKLDVPVITYNSIFMDLGATMSLVADLPTTARQAALLSKKIIGESVVDNFIQFPAGSRIMLNSHKVEEYKIKLNPESLGSVDELYK